LRNDDVAGNAFLAEPSSRNVIYLPSKGVDHPSKESAVGPSAGSNVLEAYLRIEHKHQGYYAIGKVILLPMPEAS
jgi:hypothetical protein